MNKKTIQAADFAKKPYAAPEIRAYQVKVTNIIATSPTGDYSTTEAYTEETFTW